MGLDVYLYKCPDQSVSALEELYEERTNPLFDDGNDLTYHERKQIMLDIATELGLNEWGQHPSRQKIDQPSTKYPGHLFKLGYFRSSYNGSGIDSYFRRLGLPILEDIFEPGDEYEFTPDWTKARANTIDALRLYDEYFARPESRFDTFAMEAMPIRPDLAPCSAKEALEAYAKEITLPSFGGAYSNALGYFYPEPLKVHALIPGVNLNTSCVYVVFERDNEDWYRQALEIVLETVDYVLAQPDKQDYYLHWSG